MKILKILIALTFFAVVVGGQTGETPPDRPFTEFLKLKYVSPYEGGGIGCRFGPSTAKVGPSLTTRFLTFLKPYLTESGEVDFDNRSNTLIVTDRFDNVRTVVDFVKSIDRPDMSIEEIIGEPRPDWRIKLDEMPVINPGLLDEIDDDPPKQHFKS